ncbi:uncharacterized protein PITG_22723 [Phytophthora infestans T30-4]|uniref:Secreted RxLR effector peptide protein n=2 Tax=Phytophthora infestans TaxID=4787 RepID=D0N0H3_PHYIT|nr:uncharacterized protein PITG_22723 [Phytophthora infestans T30-4]EEY67136.1 conserved hypothetical protein [Phytophthora infestans T30-4]KAF4046761.1 hypothetical protein GN244_ATG00760 [Phytophthora infestans]KAF4130456.1 hypothetical protein GN958_ATG20350 [Phytophthora infestans]|eukprot:XP_002905784.1 conserved hypothetical protein [Phytophthora infestans T30-4]
MPSPIQIPRSCYPVLLVTAILLFRSASALFELPNGATESLSKGDSIYEDDKANTVVRFLKDGATSNVDFGDELAHNEERGFLRDIFSTMAIKTGMRVSLHMEKSPHQVLKELVRTRKWLSEKTVLLWLKDVLQYRKKMDDTVFTDKRVIESLSKAMPGVALGPFLKSIEKNSNLKSFVQDLQKVT